MFKLSDYAKQIQAMASEMNVSSEVATNRFIENLALMKDQWPVADKALNFRAMGQQWNVLSSAVRLAQKAEVIKMISRTTTRRVAD